MTQSNADKAVPDKAQQLKACKEQLDSIRQTAEQSPDHEQKLADFVTNQSAGMYLTGSNQGSPLRCLTPNAFQIYFDGLYEQLGGPECRDPLHRLMVEQLVIAHHTIGRLMMSASTCTDAEMLRTQCTLATQLMSEFRRMVQAVEAYEPKRAGKPARVLSAKEALQAKQNMRVRRKQSEVA